MKPIEEYQPLPAFVFANDPSGRVVCLWKLTWRERIRILFAGQIWHQIMTFGHPLQPQLLQLAKPFTAEYLAAITTEKQKWETQSAVMEELLLKYGDKIRDRKLHCDKVCYHPNDRRRSLVIEPGDFARAKANEILFLFGIRLTDENHNSAVK